MVDCPEGDPILQYHFFYSPKIPAEGCPQDDCLDQLEDAAQHFEKGGLRRVLQETVPVAEERWAGFRGHVGCMRTNQSLWAISGNPWKSGHVPILQAPRSWFQLQLRQRLRTWESQQWWVPLTAGYDEPILKDALSPTLNMTNHSGLHTWMFEKD